MPFCLVSDTSTVPTQVGSVAGGRPGAAGALCVLLDARRAVLHRRLACAPRATLRRACRQASTQRNAPLQQPHAARRRVSLAQHARLALRAAQACLRKHVGHTAGRVPRILPCPLRRAVFDSAVRGTGQQGRHACKSRRGSGFCFFKVLGAMQLRHTHASVFYSGTWYRHSDSRFAALARLLGQHCACLEALEQQQAGHCNFVRRLGSATYKPGPGRACRAAACAAARCGRGACKHLIR